jgi:hypothetical protein
LDAGGWEPPPRLPLGGAWSGFCQALASGSFTPPEALQRELCNCGYARGRCAYFPAESQTDAVRFALTGTAANGEQRLLYIFEKDHAPAAFGEFREAEHTNAAIAQAIAFRGGLRLKGQAQPR